MDVKLAGQFAELAYDPVKEPPLGWEPLGVPDVGYAEGGTQGAFRICRKLEQARCVEFV
jgi:hypothetical protein